MMPGSKAFAKNTYGKNIKDTTSDIANDVGALQVFSFGPGLIENGEIVVGSIVKGIIEIYGTTSEISDLYFYET